MSRDLFYRTIGDRIREAREHRGWTQLRLAVELGVTPVAVHGWERAKRRPDLWTLRQIERATRSEVVL
jgi:UDP-N-acetylglucosamine 1-carboxyvinyltransferase